jgi:hypothetical protein
VAIDGVEGEGWTTPFAVEIEKKKPTLHSEITGLGVA